MVVMATKATMREGKVLLPHPIYYGGFGCVKRREGKGKALLTLTPYSSIIGGIASDVM